MNKFIKGEKDYANESVSIGNLNFFKGDKMNKLKSLWKIFLSFLKIGAFTFGGGYAMIPLIQKETVEKNKWISNDDILEIIAISESTPGAISVNVATFIGYRVAGFWGAFVGTFGLIIPSFVIIFCISSLLRSFQDNTIVKYAFYGIRAGVLALIFNSLCKMYKQVSKSMLAYFIMILALALTAICDVNAILVIVLCAVIGLIYSFCMERRIKK